MSELAVKTYTAFVLPPSVVTKRDVSRLVDEVERVDNSLTTSSVRAKTGIAEQINVVLSDVLKEFLIQNQLTLKSSRERTDLIKQLRQLKDTVPVIHMTFAVTADPESLQQLVAWLRTSIHRQAVISVGLQPALIAGVYLRTPNHVHDLSLRAMLEGSQGILIKELETLRVGR